MPQVNSFVFDFDSTLITVESFDEIIALALDGNAEIRQQIEEITNAGMNGEIDLAESLTKRLNIASISQKHIDAFCQIVTDKITPGLPEVIGFLHENNQKVFILSGGFRETIIPVADALHIPREHCFGNTFQKDTVGNITGIDFTNPLSTSRGKIDTISRCKAEAKMPGKIICIGDGMSDANPYLEGVADEFWGFFANVDRAKVRTKATRSFGSGEEVLKHLSFGLVLSDQIYHPPSQRI